MNKPFKIFVDFDGTITKQDVGEMIFRKFGKAEHTQKIISDYLSKKISAKECWLQLCETTGQINIDEFNNFIDSMEIDDTFHRLVKFSSDTNSEMIILSDGFDYYINRVLVKAGLNNIKYFSNKLSISDDFKLHPEFPYSDEMSISSANCKWNHILNHSSEDDFTVFIGDGLSDNETVQYCDYVFAKDSLLRFCEMERITFFPFKNFIDVVKKLEELNSKKRLKKRHQAVIKRKHAYMME